MSFGFNTARGIIKRSALGEYSKEDTRVETANDIPFFITDLKKASNSLVY
jgi:hypothetical protein